MFANELDFQLQLDDWFDERANARIAQDAALPPDRPAGRGARGDGAAAGDRAGHRPALGAPGRADPYLRFDTCDYSLDPRLVGRRVEVRVTEREVSRSRWTPASSPAATARSFAEHRTITALEHARALQRRSASAPRRAGVEVRSLAGYDELIA